MPSCTISMAWDMFLACSFWKRTYAPNKYRSIHTFWKRVYTYFTFWNGIPVYILLTENVCIHLLFRRVCLHTFRKGVYVYTLLIKCCLHIILTKAGVSVYSLITTRNTSTCIVYRTQLVSCINNSSMSANLLFYLKNSIEVTLISKRYSNILLAETIFINATSFFWNKKPNTC